MLFGGQGMGQGMQMGQLHGMQHSGGHLTANGVTKEFEDLYRGIVDNSCELPPVEPAPAVVRSGDHHQMMTNHNEPPHRPGDARAFKADHNVADYNASRGCTSGDHNNNMAHSGAVDGQHSSPDRTGPKIHSPAPKHKPGDNKFRKTGNPQSPETPRSPIFDYEVNANGQEDGDEPADLRNCQLRIHDFAVGRTLGMGAFGRVRFVTLKQSSVCNTNNYNGNSEGESNCTYSRITLPGKRAVDPERDFYALKQLKKAMVIQQNQFDQLVAERDILSRLSHPIIVNM
jgi:hypothetical protein